MPETTIKLIIKWENEAGFELTSKEDDNETITIVKLEENACIGTIWDNVANICNDYFSHLMRRIGDDMKE